MKRLSFWLLFPLGLWVLAIIDVAMLGAGGRIILLAVFGTVVCRMNAARGL